MIAFDRGFRGDSTRAHVSQDRVMLSWDGKRLEQEGGSLSHRDVIGPVAVFLLVVLLSWGIGAGPALAGEADQADRAGSHEIASLADEANLSRSTTGETFEDDSHSIHEEASRFEGSDHFDRYHDLEGEHERSETEHGGESEHGGGDDSGGGDSGGGSEGGND
jgi:uncharacterized membrane protein YgcG